MDSLAPDCLLGREPQLLPPLPHIQILLSSPGLWSEGLIFIMSTMAEGTLAPTHRPDLTRPKGTLAPLAAEGSDDAWPNRVWDSMSLSFLEKSRQHT